MNAITNIVQQDQKQDWLFTITLTGQHPNSLKVINFQWQEEISSLYHGSVTVASHNFNINLNDCIDKTVYLCLINKYDGEKRYLHGVVESISSLGRSTHWAKYHLSIKPDLHRLDHTSDCEIFQAKTVPEIVNEVLNKKKFKLPVSHLKDTRLPREYCVQYRETHLSFIERLLAEEGIFYYWKHTKAGAELHFSDLTQLTPTLIASPTLQYNDNAGGRVKGQFIQQFEWRETVRSNKLVQRDYSFFHPRYNQQQTTQRRRDGGEHAEYELYNGYGRYKEDNSGERFTNYRLEAVRNDASVGVGSSNVMHLSAGQRFSIIEHPYEKLNQKYLVIGVTHNGQQPQAMEEHSGGSGTFFSNQFQVHAESNFSWRPTQKYKPLMDGPQMAKVVGPTGEEIYTDKYGRVKLHFPWDRYSKENDKSSCWVRVSQAWAGTRWGFVAIPRIGHEVIVDFLEGDPDQPIVIGRTYHEGNMPPYELPANKTQTGIKSRSSKGGNATNFNEIRFEDLKGQEQIYVHAEKNQDNIVENDETTDVGHDRTEHVHHNETITIDNDRTETVHHDEKITIDNNRTESVGVNETISIGNNRKESVGNNETISIGTNRTESVGANETVSIGGNRSVNIGANKSETVGASKTETIAAAKALSIGAALQLSIGAAKNESVGLSSTEQVGLLKHIIAGKRFELQVGASSLILNADGTIILKGKEIKIEGSKHIEILSKLVDIN